MIDLREPAVNGGPVAGPIEDVVEGVFVTGRIGEPNSVVSQHRVDGVGNGCDEIAQEPGRHHLARLLMEFGIGKLGCPVDPDEHAQLVFCCLHRGDVEEADRIGFELLLWLLRPGREIGGRGPILPLCHSFLVDAITPSQYSQAFLTMLDCATDRLCRRGAAPQHQNLARADLHGLITAMDRLKPFERRRIEARAATEQSLAVI